MTEHENQTLRLDQLPRKVSTPLRQLIAVGQLDRETLDYVLDAGELSGDSSKLIGFAVGFLHLRGRGVPVHDVITMAKQQGRRITLSWSAKRWQTEHDRLSRAEALFRLAKDNVAYDVAEFEAHLPQRFAGYLIRSSRRLGMEGLRQRHCVASYHDRLRRKDCAIVTTFVDHKRWTVQIFLTGEPDAPLRVVQVRSRHNQVPDRKTLEAIHQILGIAIPATHSKSPVSEAVGRTYLDTLRMLLPIVRLHGVETITVAFDGYGDDGCIHSIRYGPEDSEAVRDIAATYYMPRTIRENGRWRVLSQREDGTVEDALEALTYDYLEETDVDWYNNDGGFGELRIDVVNGQVSLEVNVRYSDSTCEYNAERCIQSGEDL